MLVRDVVDSLAADYEARSRELIATDVPAKTCWNTWRSTMSVRLR